MKRFGMLAVFVAMSWAVGAQAGTGYDVTGSVTNDTGYNIEFTDVGSDQKCVHKGHYSPNTVTLKPGHVQQFQFSSDRGSSGCKLSELHSARDYSKTWIVNVYDTDRVQIDTGKYTLGKRDHADDGSIKFWAETTKTFSRVSLNCDDSPTDCTFEEVKIIEK